MPGLDRTYVVAPIESGYLLADNVEVVPAAELATLLMALLSNIAKGEMNAIIK